MFKVLTPQPILTEVGASGDVTGFEAWQRNSEQAADTVEMFGEKNNISNICVQTRTSRFS